MHYRHGYLYHVSLAFIYEHTCSTVIDDKPLQALIEATIG